ncbi:unnamed protein product [Cladocopium goreaui]|uniref:Uncharacterized protein n=1 Tax=Cladocopium goreaui TaxID=2562237 RepID=A0A9P1G329_9DINO|nr:unnamed protein product [Cladocopium goreaui]
MDIQTNVLWASDALNPWQVTRSICAGVLVFVDLLVTVQDRTWRMLEDWDFPTFEEPLEIQVPTKVLGTFSDKLKSLGTASSPERVSGL